MAVILGILKFIGILLLIILGLLIFVCAVVLFVPVGYYAECRHHEKIHIGITVSYYIPPILISFLSQGNYSRPEC